MTESDLEEFGTLMMAIGELYSKALSPALLKLYWNALEAYDLADVRRALTIHTRDPDHGPFFPKPGDVERALQGNKETRAMVAWSKVERAVRCVGPWQSVVFDDPIIHAVVRDMGGWIALCGHADKEWPFRRAEFVKRYSGELATGGQVRHPPYLPGMTEQQNAVSGRTSRGHLSVIGDLSAARLVYKGGENSGPALLIRDIVPRLAAS